MAAVVIFESIYGNTREVANAVAAGLGENTLVAAVGDADEAVLTDTELLVVGGPTHMHGLATSMSRKMAVKGAEEDSDVELDPAARSERGVRDVLADLGEAARRLRSIPASTSRPRSREARLGELPSDSVGVASPSSPIRRASLSTMPRARWPRESSSERGDGARRCARSSSRHPPLASRWANEGGRAGVENTTTTTAITYGVWEEWVAHA